MRYFSLLLVNACLFHLFGCTVSQGPSPSEEGTAAQRLEDDDDDCGCDGLPRTVAGFDLPESAYWDEGSDAWYVSSMGGSFLDKDGVGWISKLSRCGDVIEAQWVSGLDSPKGLRSANGKLYVGDVDQLVIIDITTKAVTKIAAPGAVLLNDPAVAPDGSVYVTDVFANTIWRFRNGTGTIFFSSPLLDLPNGLLFDKGDLLIASTGTLAPPITLGKVWRLDLQKKTLSQYGSFEDKMDGIERYRNGYLVSVTGTSTVHFVTKKGSSVVHDFSADGLSAINDIGLDRDDGVLAVPAYLDGTVTFYPLGDD